MNNYLFQIVNRMCGYERDMKVSIKAVSFEDAMAQAKKVDIFAEVIQLEYVQ